jgi:hypothetical protein
MYTKFQHCGIESWAARLAQISRHATVTFENRRLGNRRALRRIAFDDQFK